MSKWLNELGEIESLEVPRCLSSENPTQVSFHVFVDASQEAYGAVIYAVNYNSNGQTLCKLGTAKSRVAPVKAHSIPRLELMAAVVGLRLAIAVANALNISVESTMFWSDSMNVLCWIKSSSRTFKSFVAKRVGEIQTATSPAQWRYVPSEINPADMLSRGISASTLVESHIWWSGPSFLEKDENEWPEQNIAHPRKDSENSTTTKFVALVTQLDSESPWKLDPKRFSSWQRYTRVFAWVNRFLYNSSSPKDVRMSGELSYEELENVEMKVIAQVQQEEFPEEYSALKKGKSLPLSSKLLSLHPVLDDDCVMRLDGRLRHVECLPMKTKFPIILPRRSWVTKLIVKHYHEVGKHVLGTNQTLASISSKYWIISAREEIREWEKACARCKLNKTRPASQIMAPLPKFRLQPSFRAFAHTAVDFAGPFNTIQGRGKKRRKPYLCLFTCLATRAVHLEVAFGLDTDSFLNAFYRMANRRGLPELMISDNGTNFVGAVKELKELVDQIDKNTASRSLANRGVKWNFNPPYAPHFGGVFETMIKAAKRALYAILGNGDVTDEDLITAMTGAEALINSRPLTYQSANSQDEVPLTPNHFLHGQCGGIFAPEPVDIIEFNPRKHWRRVQELVHHFWKRWMREWLPSLNPRKKWQKSQRDLQVKDVVLVISPNVPRGQWQLGTITRTYPGPDGHTRVVEVQVGHSVLTRPIHKICPLEWSTMDEPLIDKPDVDTVRRGRLQEDLNIVGRGPEECRLTKDSRSREGFREV